MPLPRLRALLSSFLPSAHESTTSRRIESCPPLAHSRRAVWAARFGRRDTLPNARLDFADALIDVRSAAAMDLLSRIAVTRSLHELWHLREEVFSLVSRRHSQDEAQRRLATLNRHFLRGNRRPALPSYEADRA
jgi:hypothetical protein